jgi:hypothetical protein
MTFPLQFVLGDLSLSPRFLTRAWWHLINVIFSCSRNIRTQKLRCTESNAAWKHL